MIKHNRGMMTFSGVWLFRIFFQIAVAFCFTSLTKAQTMQCMHQCGPFDSSTYPSCDSCRQFIKCMYGKTETLMCPSNLLWDVRMMTCNYPYMATCSCRECGNPSHSPMVQPAREPVKTTKRPIRYPRPECGLAICNGRGTSYQPHCSDCTKYIRCVNNENVGWWRCAHNFHFDAISHRCMSPEQATCRYFGQAMKPPVNNKPVFDCPSSICFGHGSSFRPHCSDCHRFVRCSNNALVATYNCDYDYIFDIYQLRCKTPREAVCITDRKPAYPTRKTTKVPTTYPVWTTTTYTPRKTTKLPAPYPTKSDCSDTICGGYGPLYRPHCSECGKFVKCYNGHITATMECPYRYEFDSRELRCKPANQAMCKTRVTTAPPRRVTDNPKPAKGVPIDCLATIGECQKRPDGKYANCHDCTSYIQCYRSKGFPMPCPSTTRWDPERKACKYSVYTPCWSNSNSVTDRLTTKNTFYRTTTTTPTTTTQRTTTTQTTTTTQRPPVTHKTVKLCKDGCAGLSDGVYAMCPDCSRFIMCSFPHETIYNCPSGKYFNYRTQTCSQSYRCENKR